MMAEKTEEHRPRARRRTAIGVVTRANKSPKTIRVEVQFQVRHPIYGKYLRRTTVLHAHDEKETSKPGDRVQLMECRRISKTKAWRLVKVLETAPA